MGWVQRQLPQSPACIVEYEEAMRLAIVLTTLFPLAALAQAATYGGLDEGGCSSGPAALPQALLLAMVATFMVARTRRR